MVHRVLLLLVTLLLAAEHADAAWLPGGNRLGDGAHHDDQFVMSASGPDRVVVAWMRDLLPDGHEIRAQAWTTDGALVPGWTEAGVKVSDFTFETFTISICEDGAGGAYIGWSATDPANWGRFTIRLQHLSADGSPVAGWPEGGLAFETTEHYSGATVTPDGAGGVFLGRRDRIQWNDYRCVVFRIASNGTTAAGWPAQGVTLAGAGMLLLGDAEHVFVSTTEVTAARGLTEDTRIRRLLGNGAADPAWPANGLLLKGTYAHLLFPDGAGGVYFERGGSVNWDCWQPLCPPTRRIARILGDGTPDARWGEGYPAFDFAPDGTGGVLLGVVVDGGRPAMLHLDSAGSAIPGWEVPGNRVMTEVVVPRAITVAHDGQGGAFMTWWDRRTGTGEAYSSRLDANGHLAAGWPSTGSFAVTPGSGPAQLVVLESGTAVALFDREVGTTTREGYLAALEPREPGALADLGPVPEEVGFGIVQMMPNPSHGLISLIAELRAEGPASIEIVDPSGRVHESREYNFASQARGVVRMNTERRLAPGIYWVHLQQGAHRTSKKLVVLP